ncbi:MAG: large subunit ribosomal protein [Moorella sp. (in: firmicutes)]|uniref:Large ribosomal subunit protein bL17 n=1 Tax=Neomoorella thermoacetica TaxID=1525 RepID=A0A1J5NL40_NEOTH|nr:large subunit ribosomal protein [Moorella sp. (in: firmicutes)]OIQ59032.1 50S ribosomal protein L17 [Moorella thermoacetica]
MAYRKLGRLAGHRKMMLRNIVTSLLKHGKIETTELRAKELKSLAEKMITLGKRGDLHSRRQALAYLLDEDVVTKLFKDIGPRYADKNGGYTRIVKTGYRQGDGAPMVQIELV